jgi:hypothetical protein
VIFARAVSQLKCSLRSAFENWLRIGIQSKKANYINAGQSLGKERGRQFNLSGRTAGYSLKPPPWHFRQLSPIAFPI